MSVLHIEPRDITARTTGVNRGRRVYRSRVLHRVDRIETDFIPPTGTRPTQARIRHYIFEPRLRRWSPQVDLVVQADIAALIARAER